MSLNLFQELTNENVNANYTLRKLKQLNASVINTSMLETQSVRYYGAGTGDATVDDTPLILQCVNANIGQPYGGIVYLPDDVYYIKTPLVIPACTNLKFYGNDSTLILSTGAYVIFNSCENLELCGINVIPMAGAVFTGGAIRLSQCQNFNVYNLNVIGNASGEHDMNSTFLFPTGILLISSFGSDTSNILYNCQVSSCTHGIVVANQYTHVQLCNIFYCTYGIVFPSGNSSLKNSVITNCRIGAYIYGPNATYMVPDIPASPYSSNPDHSILVGNTINHCSCTALHFNSCTSGFLVSGNTMIANGHGITSINSANTGYQPYTLNEAYDTMGKLHRYGIYIQRSVNITIVGNQIQSNYVGIGCSAYKNCLISANHIFCSYAGIVDYSNDNVATTAPSIAFFANGYNCITNNNFVSPPISSIFGNSSPILFFGTLPSDGGYDYSGNCGSAYRQSLRLTTDNAVLATGFVANPKTLTIHATATANYTITGAFQTYIIDFGCSSTLTFGKSLYNTSFNIVMIGAVASKVISAFNLTTADGNLVDGDYLTVADSGTSPTITRTFTFTRTGIYHFINVSANAGEWFIQCPP